jgi:hypothetical protein
MPGLASGNSRANPSAETDSLQGRLFDTLQEGVKDVEAAEVSRKRIATQAFTGMEVVISRAIWTLDPDYGCIDHLGLAVDGGLPLPSYPGYRGYDMILGRIAGLSSLRNGTIDLEHGSYFVPPTDSSDYYKGRRESFESAKLYNVLIDPITVDLEPEDPNSLLPVIEIMPAEQGINSMPDWAFPIASRL